MIRNNSSFIVPLQTDLYAGMELPAQLQSCLDRHRENLARLVASLESAGMSEAAIERSVSIVIASYQAELVKVFPIWARQANG
jgi:hypothetical protein